MHDKVIYGGFELGNVEVSLLNENEARDLAGEVVESNGVVFGVKLNPIRTYPLHVEWHGESAKANANAFEDFILESIEQYNAGEGSQRLEVDGWWCDGIISSAKKSGYTLSGSFVTEYQFTQLSMWSKLVDVKTMLHPSQLTYTDEFVNDGAESDFLLEIKGATSAGMNASVIVNGAEIGIKEQVPSGKKLVIDSKSKEVYVCNQDGSGMIDKYENRCNPFYTFRRLHSGKNLISSDVRTDSNISLYMYKGRMCPEW